MICSHYEKHILLTETGELSRSLKAQLAAHLAHCPHCRAFQTDMRELNTIARSGLSKTPNGPTPGVMQQIQNAAGAPRRRKDHLHPRFAQALLALAASLMVLAGIWRVTSRTPVGRTPTDSRTDRIAEWSSLLAAMMETDDPTAESEEGPHANSDLQSLARQLLILQDVTVELPEDPADGATPAEAHQPTTLRWHNNRAAISQTYG